MKYVNIFAAAIVGASIVVASLILSAALRDLSSEVHYTGDRISAATANAGR